MAEGNIFLLRTLQFAKMAQNVLLPLSEDAVHQVPDIQDQMDDFDLLRFKTDELKDRTCTFALYVNPFFLTITRRLKIPASH